MKADELGAVVAAMTRRPWRWGGGGANLKLQSPSGYTVLRIDGYEAAGDTAAILALANHADALVELVRACERLDDAVNRGADVPSVSQALHSVLGSLSTLHAIT